MATRPELPPEVAFQRIAPVYDKTRDPLDAEIAAAAAAAFRGRGWTRILEIAVGTGRVASPLAGQGLRITGVDAARAMLAQAAAKGLAPLVQGNAYRLPFRPGSFDAALMAHLLHMLDDPGRALSEAGRVTGDHVAALFTFPTREEPVEGELRDEMLRSELHEQLRAEGVSIPPFRAPWRKERELLLRFPPTETVALGNREVREPIDRRVAAFELRGYRNLADVPPEPLARAVAGLRERYRDRVVTSRRSYALAIWRADALACLATR